MTIKWDIKVNVSNWKIFAGHFIPELPKILFISGKRGQLPEIIADLITLASEFMIYTENSSMGQLRAIQLLHLISSSPITNYTFILSTKVTEEEHTDPRVLGAIHRKLKTPLLLTSIPEKAMVEISIEDAEGKLSQDFIELSATLTLLSLLTAATRRGLELRQIFFQNIVLLMYLLFKQQSETALSVEEKLEEMAKLVVFDTYSWYRERLNKLMEPLEAELRHLAVHIPAPKEEKTSLENFLRQRLVPQYRDFFVEWIEEVTKNIKELLGIRVESLIGRLWLIANTLRNKEFSACEEIVTIATGQWSTAQLLLLSELLNVKKFHVLYTPNSLLPRLLDEWMRKKIMCIKAVNELEVNYYPIPSTDAIIAEKIIDSVLEQADKPLVIAQGPSTISLQLYWKSRIREKETVLL